MRFPSRRAYHVIYDASLEDAIKYAAANDWNGIVPDFGVPTFSPEKISADERTRLRDLSKELSIEWGFHAPGDDVSLFSTYPPVREGILKYFKQVINLAREVSVKPTNVVVHAGTPPSFKKAGVEKDVFSNVHEDTYTTTLRENLIELIEHAKPNVTIVLENVNWTPIVCEVLQRLFPTGLKICLDIPKLFDVNFRMNNSDWNFFQQHKSVIEVVHIHDSHPVLKSHQIVGEGIIDFERVLRLLDGLPTKPQYVFEVRPKEAAHQSLMNLGRLMEILKLDL
ncbi:MAG: sugar phosphate isomerase/epimerase family protein [Candidatus Thorarchaeota archaeon]